MGESDRYSDYKKPKTKLTFGQEGNALVSLITINIVFFLLLQTIKVIYFVFESPEIAFRAGSLQYFELPAQLSSFAKKPWTVLTYMFSDVEVFRILSNMLWLWAFGFILQELTGSKKLIPVYIYGGIAGALFFILANYALPPLRQDIGSAALLGANAAVMAVAVAVTTLVPGYRFFRNLGGGIPIWVLMLVYVLIDYAGISTESAAYSIAHLGGGLAGFLFIVFLRKDIDGSLWMNNLYNWFMNLFNPNKKQVSAKEKIFYKNDGRAPYKKSANLTQQRVDEILDKINQKGYQFLTEEEKNILKRASEEDL
ncbi:rhomboid family intramembrane serine protease [Ferruginibacter sp. SUN002]|uniref:rhomboid family intramembrane serine protease n=1 Tax=Ferruginibacter sp. SUN002 TaxID=2937789 RepID=UPI003D367575